MTKNPTSYTVQYYYKPMNKKGERFIAASTDIPAIEKTKKGDNDSIKSVPQRCVVCSSSYGKAKKILAEHARQLLSVPKNKKIECEK